MTRIRLLAGAAALVCAHALSPMPALAKADDYRFELVGEPHLAGGKDIVQLRIVHMPDSKLVVDAVIFESTADMGPAGMAAMTAPVKSISATGGIYSFGVEPGGMGIWALHLAAKVQGEPETVRGTITVELVK